MLNVSGATVCHLVELARHFHAQEAVTIPQTPEDVDDDWPAQVLASHRDDPVLAEFHAVINDLEPDQQQAVVALLWLGRGDFSYEEWDEALDLARTEWRSGTADYLLAHPLLADHLEDGLAEFGIYCDA